MYDLESTKIMSQKGYVRGKSFDLSDWGAAEDQVSKLSRPQIKEELEYYA